jgi:pectate lyase
MNTRLVALFFLFSTSVLSVWSQPLAFPGAQGWGAFSQGGRAGVVIEVTNLNDSGPGSLRDACSATGARTVVFRTGGVINLQSEIQLFNPFITIAGQTAPGDGIVLKNFPLSVFTHDVIIRGLRIRIGDDLPKQSPDNRDCLSIQSGSYNVMVDHCSFSWGLDENVSVLNAGVHSVSIQWCVIAEGLYANVHPKGFHSMGILVAYDAVKTSVHHNLFAHNGGRNPLIARQTDHEFVNNVVYDWKYNADLLEQGVQLKLDFRGNYYKPKSANPFPELPLHLDFDGTTTLGSRLNMTGNFFSPSTPFISATQLAGMGSNAIVFASASTLSSASTIPSQSASAGYAAVLNAAGAQHPRRDATDLRVIQSVRDSTGTLIDCMDNTPRLLESGTLISATSSTIVYTMQGKPVDYSPESRKIVITGGLGAGQVRYGIESTPVLLNAATLTYEAKIDVPWTTIPNNTSTYEWYAGCKTVLNGYPVYAAGSAPADTDHDGMPDTWEQQNGLNPGSATDRNATTINAPFTNLEVYLNTLYDGVVTDVTERGPGLSVYPNPFTDRIMVNTHQALKNVTIQCLNVMGQEVIRKGSMEGNEFSVELQVPVGVYLLRIWEGPNLVGTVRLMKSAH